MTNSWIIATDTQVGSLVESARSLGGTVTAVVLGDVPVAGVDRIISIPVPEGTPAEALAPAVAAAVAAEPGDVVFTANRADDRALAGAVAAKLNAPTLLGVKELESGKAKVSRYGGISEEFVSFSSPIVVVSDGGTSVEGAAPTAETVEGDAFPAKVTAVNKEEVSEVNLAASKRIVSAGRGFKNQEDLAIAEALAAAMGADLACSRPLAEGNNWLGRDRYIGISGQHVAPDLYVAAGISGQIQHTAGMNDAKVVVAINSDEKAPYFDQADYGIVGDLYMVLPAITAALN